MSDDPDTPQVESGVDAPTIRLTADTLAGSIRDFILNQLRYNHSPVPWDERSEEDQKRLVAQVSDLVRAGVTDAVRAIAASSRPVMAGVLKSIAVQGGIKAVIELQRNDPLRHELMDAAGQEVLLVVSDARPFLREGSAVEIKPDQGDIERYAQDAAEVAAATEDPEHPLHGTGSFDEAMPDAGPASSDEAPSLEDLDAEGVEPDDPDPKDGDADEGDEAEAGEEREVAGFGGPPRKAKPRKAKPRRPVTPKAAAAARRLPGHH